MKLRAIRRRRNRSRDTRPLYMRPRLSAWRGKSNIWRIGPWWAWWGDA